MFNLNCCSCSFGKFEYTLLVSVILNISHKIIQNYIIVFFLKSFGENKIVKPVKVLPASIKLINPMQKYSHITESYAWLLKVFVFMFLLCEADDERQSVTF